MFPRVRYHECGEVLVWVKGEDGARDTFYNREGQQLRRCWRCRGRLTTGTITKEPPGKEERREAA